MKKKFVLALIPAIFYGEDLRSLLEFATLNNKTAQSKSLTKEAKLKEVESSKSAYFPTLDAGGYYQNQNQRTPQQPGDTYNGYAKIGVDIYDGGKKWSLVKQNEALLEAAMYDAQYYKKSLQLDIAQDFYNIKSLKASLTALEDKRVQLEADLDRIKKFFDVGSATIDDVDKLQAAYSSNLYIIEESRYQLLSLIKLLGVKIGKEAGEPDSSTIEPPQNIQNETGDDVKSLRANSFSLARAAEGITSVYYPQLRLEDNYSVYNYGRSDFEHPKGVYNQNTLALSLNIRLFDNGVVTKQKESLQLQKMALDKRIKELEETRDINAELSLSKINTTKAQIQSAKQGLEAANSAYKIAAKKFEAGVVDNVAYLDALSVKTNAKAQYETALNNLQIAYASYYFNTNKNIKEYVK
ncbi:MAG TPA: TolC family protein [Campylobacterales bacterium]|nr:TolC family protein [Campylobacterales bacterium]